MRVRWLVLCALMFGVGEPAFAKDKSKGGDPCAGVRQHTDAFGVTSRGQVVYVGIGAYLAVAIVQMGEEKEIQTLYVRRGVVDEVLPSGTPGKVALADGTVLLLSSSKESRPVTGANEGGVFTQWNIPYALNAEQLAQLAASPITAVGAEIGGQPLQFEVPIKKAPKLQAAAACIGS